MSDVEMKQKRTKKTKTERQRGVTMASLVWDRENGFYVKRSKSKIVQKMPLAQRLVSGLEESPFVRSTPQDLKSVYGVKTPAALKRKFKDEYRTEWRAAPKSEEYRARIKAAKGKVPEHLADYLKAKKSITKKEKPKKASAKKPPAKRVKKEQNSRESADETATYM